MKRRTSSILLAVAVVGVVMADCVASASAFAPNMLPVYRSRCYNWNYNYVHQQYGQPVALVVPPTVNLRTDWGWGVGSSRVAHMDHQFGRNYPGYGPYGGPYHQTPAWPSDTTQFGVYPVRGPW